MQKLCVIYNTAPRYREAVFCAIDKEYDCDWYFGETKSDIKEMNTSLLKNVTYYKTYGNPQKWYWKRNYLRLLLKRDYKNYLILPETRCISDWLYFLLAYTFFRRKHFYLWTHGWYGKENRFNAKMKLWLYRHATGVFVYGDRAKRLLIEQGIPKEKLFVIHNSLDYDTQKKIRESIVSSNIYKEHFQNELPTIIFIGRLTKVKKLDMLVDALDRLRVKGEKYNLVFIGDGSEGKSLKSKVKSLNLDNQVWFYGACYDEKINAELIYNADLCVSPGNVGLTAMHSLSFGCPVITHNSFEWQMPEYEAIQAGVTGDFFTMDDIDEMTDVISRWFSSHLNSRQEIRKACFNEIDTNWNPYYQMDIIKKNLKFL